ncbi:MAG: hypothetical protein HYY01_14305 [Chloroflexi bacterium]|nr:hypothetical protein [Chloroflexota bacterium]
MRLPWDREGRQVLALTIEQGAVKLVLAQRQRVLDHRLQPVNPAFFREGLPAQPGRVARVIAGAVKEFGGSIERVVATVPGFQSMLQVLELPKAHGLDPREVIPREAARAMGIPLERSVLRWHRLPDWQDRTRWLVVAAPRRSVDAVVETLRQAGLGLHGLELRPFALARAVNVPDAIVAWLGADGADVVLVRHHAPVVCLGVAWGAEVTEGPVLVERLSQMVEQALARYRGSSPEGWVADDVPLFVCGVPAGLEGEVGPGVAANLGRELQALRPPMEVTEDFPVHELVINLGLALGEA